MIRTEIVVMVAGNPKPKGSLKCIGGRGGKGHVLIEDNAGTKGWRAELVRYFKKVTQHAASGQPIAVECTFTIARPNNHYGTGRNAAVLKASAPPFPVAHNTGDADKLLRTLLDAIQDAKVFPDDCQVVEVTGRKAYPGSPVPDALDHAGALIRIYPYDGQG